jgi:hypothetical protein
MGGQTQDRSRAYQNFRIQRLLFRVAAGLIAPYKKPWLFPQALGIAEEVIRPVSDGGKIKYEQGVDPREICNLRYLTVIRERLSAALRPGEGPELFLPTLDEYQPIGSTDGLNFNSPKDKCVPAIKSHLSHAVVDSGLERKSAPSSTPPIPMSKPGSRIIGSTWRSRTCTSETHLPL